MMEKFTNFLSPAQIDPEKIIEYPGFTVPPPEGVKDVSVIVLLLLTFYTGHMWRWALVQGTLDSIWFIANCIHWKFYRLHTTVNIIQPMYMYLMLDWFKIKRV